MKKWDGHTHTEFCPHGSQDATVERIEKAIEQGFTHYSLTEHAPLPEDCLSDPQLRDECGMSIKKTDEYFRFIHELKKVYKKKITLLVGLEIDF
ncbi:MAG: PHP domain-containing protein, partial [Proteobacteria bacterium]|nr:PHP domain-containing protein [Pseudomonadota bacterium]